MDFNHIRAGTAYIGAHGIEEVCKVNDMRFLCGVFNHGQPRRFDRREHAVNGRAYRHHIQINAVAVKVRSLYIDHTVRDRIGGAKRREPL